MGKVEEAEEWLIAYVDLITLLLALFVLIVSFATLNESKFREMAQSLSSVMRGGVPLVKLPVAIETDLPAGGPRAADAEEVARQLRDRVRKAQGISSIWSRSKAVGDKVEARNPRRRAVPTWAAPKSSEQAARKLLGRPGAHPRGQGKYWISVEGHTDNVPIATEYFPSNWELSTARASNVVRRLRRAQDRARRTCAPSVTPTPCRWPTTRRPKGRARNRRVNLVLQGGDDVRPF